MIRTFALITLFGVAAPVGAAPSVSETIKYYTVTGNSLSQIRRDLARRGPNGFWGLTSWRIKWSASCEIDLTVLITLPRLSPSARLSGSERRTWDRMVDALYRHERIHVDHGRRAAAEVYANGCRTPQTIIDKWIERDRILDRVTNHGVTQGVVLGD